MTTADPLVRRVAGTIRRRRLLAAGDRVAVAVSAGPDSVGLAWALAEAVPRRDWALSGLIHVNHGLRGADSDADEAFCRDLAKELGLAIHIVSVDVRERMRTRRQSLEAAARDLRYEVFADGAAALGATVVATGHTQDDQAETVLLRLLRGAGSRGLTAIRARRGFVVRPLIDTRRSEVSDFLARHGRQFRLDSSNDDVAIARNQLRKALMPILVAEWPSSIRALARFAEIAGDDEALLTRTAVEVLPAVTLPGADGTYLDARALAALAPALARRIVRHVIETAGGSPSFRDIEAVRRLAGAGMARDHLDLHGISVTRRGPALEVRRAHAARFAAPFERELSIPGLVHISETGATVRASLMKGEAAAEIGEGGPTVARLQADLVTGPLTVRNRRPGDRFRPLGAPGRRKVKDLLIDRKIPRDARDEVPIVVDASGRILWVAGVEIAHDCRVTAPERGVVILEMKDTQ